MPRRVTFDTHGLDVLLTPGRSVASHAEMRSLGIPLSTIVKRIGPHGPWQRLLPGIVAGHRGTPTRHERRLAALKYGGTRAILTGLDALALHGLKIPQVAHDDRVHVLIPHASQRTSHGFAQLTRSRHLPPPVERAGVPCAPVPRAVVDAARRTELLDAVRDLVASAVQQGLCTVEEIIAEVAVAARQRTALTRSVLDEVEAGIRSVAEAKVRSLFAAFGVPMPEWNVPVRGDDGEVIAVVDGLWRAIRAILEIDSIAWHLSPAAYRKTQRRQQILTRARYRVLSVSPRDADLDPRAFCREVLDYLDVCSVDAGVPGWAQLQSKSGLATPAAPGVPAPRRRP